MFSLGPGGSPQNPEMSIDQAKDRLREWGVEADESLHAQIQELVSSVKKTTRSVLPWAAGGALLMGWLSGRRKKRDGSGVGGTGGKPGILRTVFGLARDLAPFAAMFMSSHKE